MSSIKDQIIDDIGRAKRCTVAYDKVSYNDKNNNTKSLGRPSQTVFARHVKMAEYHR